MKFKINDVEFKNPAELQLIWDELKEHPTPQFIVDQVNGISSSLNNISERISELENLKHNSEKFYSMPPEGRNDLLNDLDKLNSEFSSQRDKLLRYGMLKGYLDTIYVLNDEHDIIIEVQD